MAKKKKKKNDRITSGMVLNLLKEHSKPLSKNEIYKAFRPNKVEKRIIDRILDQEVSKGKLISIGKGKSYGLSERMDLRKGTLEMQNSGIGFVLPEDKRRSDIYISPENLRDAWHGDKVVVALLPTRRGKNPEGRIVRILDRKYQDIPVILAKKVGQDLYLAQPTEKKLVFKFLVDVSEISRKPGQSDVLIVKPGQQIDRGIWEGRGIRYLGQEEDPQVQESIVKVIHSIPFDFPEYIEDYIQGLPESPNENDFIGREDLTSKPFVTIDGAKAKDFDDAVYVKKKGDNWQLFVAIADVSHYVWPGDPLDIEARKRANSYYFPQSVEPMFPPKLSNELCSLNPESKRLVMVVEMTFSKEGHRKSSQFYPGVIKSQARLTYSQVKRAVLDGDQAEQNKLSFLMPMLNHCKELAEILYTKRRERGALDFDLPEPEILFNIREEAVDIRPRVRHFGHQIIEEFMISANEAVAEYLQQLEQPCMYRIHTDPDQDKLEGLFKLLKQTDFAVYLPTETDPKSLQKLLLAVEDSDMEFLVNRLLLRTMKQASYSPDNQGHFGLASDCYCHFTSPIRRYSDLIVHRSLKKALKYADYPSKALKKLNKLGSHLSDQERVAMAAEREVIKRMTIIILQDRIGENFNGLVSSVTDFGFWVELTEVLAEGMVRLSSLTDDYYLFLPKEHKLVGQRTGKVYALGTKVQICLVNVSLARQEIDFEIVEPENNLSQED